MRQRNYFLLSLFLFLLFFLRWQTLPTLPAQAGLPDFLPGQEVKISGVLRQEPKVTGSSQTFSLAGIEIKTLRYPEYHYGDQLIVVGSLKKRVTGGWFLEFPEIEETLQLHKIGIEHKILASISAWRRRIEKVYRFSLPEPQASLMAGIVLGSKSGFPNDFYQALRKTGTLHVVVASGMNITFVAIFLINTLVIFISRRKAVILAFLGIWFYVILAGWEAPVVRAGIMGSLAFLAMGLGREAMAMRGLMIAGAIMLLINPNYLFDLGFQLSFAATAGILIVYPKLRSFEKTRRVFNLPVIGDNLASTLAAQTLTLPIMVFNFGGYNPLSPLVNALVLWTIQWVMVIGAIGGILGLINLELGRLFCLLSWPLLTYFVELVKIFS
jgi:ComEC/Rec2-related protein